MAGKQPNTKRGSRAKGAATRDALLDATLQILATQGHAALTTRRVAAVIGISPTLVHYYYPTTDDLILAAYRRSALGRDKRVADALAADNPILAMWSQEREPGPIAMAAQFFAMANDRPALRKEIAQHMTAHRKAMVRSFSAFIARTSSESETSSTKLALRVAMLMDTVSLALTIEGALEVSYGHREATALLSAMFADVSNLSLQSR